MSHNLPNEQKNKGHCPYFNVFITRHIKDVTIKEEEVLHFDNVTTFDRAKKLR